MSRCWAFNTTWSVSSCWACAIGSIPLSHWWWAFASIILEVPLSWWWAWNTIISKAIWWTWACFWGFIPNYFWGRTCTIITNNFSWKLTAWAFMCYVIPSMSRLASNASLIKGIPMFWSITLNTIYSLSNIITLRTTRLLLIFSESIIGHLS